MLKENKEKLKNALIEIANREADEAAASDTQEVYLSLSFQEKARKLIQETDGHRCRVSRKVVVLIAAALIIALCSIAAYMCRDQILSFATRTFEDYKAVTVKNQYNNKVQTHTTIETIYTLDCVPEGYKEIKFEDKKTIIQTIWRNEEEKILVLTQESLNNNRCFDVEQSDCKNDSLNIIQYSYKEKEGVIVWIDSNYQYKLYWTGVISEDEIQAILSGIAIRN